MVGMCVRGSVMEIREGWMDGRKGRMDGKYGWRSEMDEW